MDVIDSKSDLELQQSVLAEVAKARNELQCAERDVVKAQNRMSFVIALMNRLIERKTER